jgi:hypothetical protein
LGLAKLQKKAPNRLKTLDAELKSAPWPLAGRSSVGRDRRLSATASTVAAEAVQNRISPSPKLDRDSGFADKSLPARPKAGLRRSSRTALRRRRRRKTDAKFSCLQTPEISQSREIFWRRRGHEEAFRWKSAMTEGASPKSSRTALGQRGAEMEGKLSCPQTLEISQNRKIIPRRSGRRDSPQSEARDDELAAGITVTRPHRLSPEAGRVVAGFHSARSPL